MKSEQIINQMLSHKRIRSITESISNQVNQITNQIESNIELNIETFIIIMR